MASPYFALLLPSLLVVPAMALLSRMKTQSPLGTELRRKALHIGVGLTALTFPLFLTGPAAVSMALLLVIAWMLLVRSVPALNRRFGCVLHEAGRVSWGEVYFALAIAGLLLLPHSNSAMYVVPLLILTISDALAAVVGRAIPAGRLPGPARGKTVSGSAAFAISAFFITAIALDALTVVGAAPILVIALATGVASCVVEAVCTRGTDNLAVPAIAWLTLNAGLAGA